MGVQIARALLCRSLLAVHGFIGWLRRSKPEVSEEDRKREAVRARLEQITQECKDAQQQARDVQKQLK